MIELVNCTNVLIDSIRDKKLKQEEISLVYAFALLSSEEKDWKFINSEIIDRWSLSGLKRVKNKAWKNVEKIKGGIK